MVCTLYSLVWRTKSISATDHITSPCKLLLRGKLISLRPDIVPFDKWSAERTGSIDYSIWVSGKYWSKDQYHAAGSENIMTALFHQIVKRTVGPFRANQTVCKTVWIIGAVLLNCEVQPRWSTAAWVLFSKINCCE